jgi:hemin uptake protein HemP
MKTERSCAASETRLASAEPRRKRVSTSDLMDGNRAVVLLHDGEEYVLRITKTGKLILTK